MKKIKVLISTLMAAGIITLSCQSASAKVDAYFIKEASTGKLYQYHVNEVMSNFNSPLFFEFVNNCKDNGIYMIHDDESEKYIKYENVEEVLKDKNSNFNLVELCKKIKGEKAPFFAYNRVIEGNKINNEINFTKNDMDIDFEILKLKEAGNIRVSGTNSNISNLNFEGDLILSPMKGGTVNLSNIFAKNIKLSSAGENEINLTNVKVEALEIESSGKINLKGNSVVKNTIIRKGSSIETDKTSLVGKLDLNLKNKDEEVKLAGNFSEVQVSKECKLDLANNTNVGKIDKLSEFTLTGEGKSNIAKLLDINTPTTSGGSSSRSTTSRSTGRNTSENKNTSSEKPNKSTDDKTSINESNSSDNKSSTNENKSSDIKPSTNENKGSDTKPSTNGNSSSNSFSEDKSGQFQRSIINKEKSSIMNIEFVNYAVVVLNEGSLEDYDFFINGEKVKAKRVNTIGNIIKIELLDRKDKTLTVKKGNLKEETILKYKEY